MATSNSALRVTELDFDSIKENLKDWLRSRSRFADFNFEGDNWQAILDVLAYNTHYYGYYTNAVANEMFLDTAQLRESVVSRAKHLNYVPSSKRAATAFITIEVTPAQGESASQNQLTLDKYTRFVSDAADGRPFLFAAMEAETVNKANGKFTFANVEIKQGEIVTTQQLFNLGSNSQRRFNIPSANVDTNTLSVIVQQSVSNTTTETYTLADDITEVTANSTVYYLEETSESNGIYSIVFGDNYLGKMPANGAVVIMTYLDTRGRPANDIDSFSLVDDINGFSGNVSISTISAAAGGAGKERIETIRFRAPIAYTVQNRAVTKTDYETLLPKDYPNLQAVSVWGGQDNDPPIYGKVFLSLLPRDGYYITEVEKQRIIDEVIADRAIVTVTPEIVDPEILYVVVNAEVRYDPKLTSLSERQLKSLVREEILSYNDEELVDFNDAFRASVLTRRIDNLDPAIKATDLKVYVQKRVPLTTNTATNYVINFGVPLKPGGIFDRISTKPAVVMPDVEGVSRQCRFEEDADTLTGVTSIKVRSGGSGYKRTPTVTITGDGVGATANAVIVNGSVSAINVVDEGTGYSQASVVIRGGNGTGANAVARLDADSATIYSFYYGTAGKKVIVDERVGSIVYSAGRIRLTNFEPISVNENDNYDEDTLVINAVPASNIIKPSRNHVVTIDEDDPSAIVVTMIAED
jgi:hypothetical protein